MKLWDTWQRDAGYCSSLRRVETLSRRSQTPVWDLDGPQKYGILHDSKKTEPETSPMVLITGQIWLPLASLTWKNHGLIWHAEPEIWPWVRHRGQPEFDTTRALEGVQVTGEEKDILRGMEDQDQEEVVVKAVKELKIYVPGSDLCHKISALCHDSKLTGHPGR